MAARPARRSAGDGCVLPSPGSQQVVWDIACPETARVVRSDSFAAADHAGLGVEASDVGDGEGK
jgi:hypothetical protein